jgi:hypothetical protein
VGDPAPELLITPITPRLNLPGKGKGKAVEWAWSGPEVSRKLRFPDYMTAAQDGGKVVNLTHRPPLPPGKYSWYSFLLVAASTPGPLLLLLLLLLFFFNGLTVANHGYTAAYLAYCTARFRRSNFGY